MDSMPSETALILQLSQGDEHAFAALYKFYQPRLYLFIFPLTGCSKPDTDEVIQDIFVKVWLRKETLVTVRSLQAYLFMMAKNRLWDIRAKHAQLKQVVNTLEQQQPDGQAEVLEKLQFNEYHEIAREAISQLSPQKQRIFALRNEQGLSLDEIATELHITKFAVKKQLYDAVRYIKAYLKKKAGLEIPLILLISSYLQH